MFHRRAVLSSLAATFLVAASVPTARAEGRKVRRRHRRAVERKRLDDSLKLVVPEKLALGWEIVVEGDVFRVEGLETKRGVEIATLFDIEALRYLEEELHREDTETNRKELKGSELPMSDKKTPSVVSDE